MKNAMKKPPIAHPSPKGFISVRDAWLQTVAAVYPEEWNRAYDLKTDGSSRKQYDEIATKLELALQEGRLQGVAYNADKMDIPADWWPCKAHVTGGQVIEGGTIIVIRETDFKRWQRDVLRIDVQVTGRPIGSGTDDTILLFEMGELIKEGKFNNPYAAAVFVAGSVKCSEVEMNTIKGRIYRKYRLEKKR